MYKVVNGDLKSAVLGNSLIGIQYKLNEFVGPHKEWAKLGYFPTVFSDLSRAKEWARAMAPKLGILKIFECEIKAKEKELPEALLITGSARRPLIWPRGCGEDWEKEWPEKTVMAAKIKLTKLVRTVRR